MAKSKSNRSAQLLSILSLGIILSAPLILAQPHANQNPNPNPKNGNQANSSRTHKQTSASSSSASNSSSFAAAPSKRNESVELAKARGQLESFSMEATGLGDLEEADAVRIMMRRSQEHQKHIEAIKSDLAMRRRKVRNGLAATHDGGGDSIPVRLGASGRDAKAKYYEEFLRSLLKMREGPNNSGSSGGAGGNVRYLETMPVGGANVKADEQELRPQVAPDQSYGEMPPIVITRRTVEELDDDLNGGLVSELDDGKLGEFGSRLSLLTTRKIQPRLLQIEPSAIEVSGDEAEDDEEKLAKLLNYKLLLPSNDKPPRDGAIGPLPPLVMTRKDLATIFESDGSAPGGSGTPATSSMWLGTNSNYLPRVARRHNM